MNASTLVLGIGNSLLSDEGAGVQAIDQLQTRYANLLADVRFLDGGTLSFTLAADIEQTDRLIVIDAARLNAPAGTLRCFENEEMDHFIGNGHLSVHEVGLVDLLDIARLTGHLPARRALIGIQPHTTDWGTELSVAVAQKMPEVISMVIALIRRWSAATQKEYAA